jgi:hypothetical protein
MKKFVVACLSLFVVVAIVASAISNDPLPFLAQLLGWKTEWKIFTFEMALVSAAGTVAVFLLRERQDRRGDNASKTHLGQQGE